MARQQPILLGVTTAALGVVLLLFPAGIDTWPFFPAIYGAYIVAALAVYYRYRIDALWMIALLAASAGIYRVALFSHPPSLIGMDPDAYAVQIARLLDGQALSQIDFVYYRKAPFHLLTPAILVRLTGISITSALAVFPMMVGIVIPTTTGLLAREIAPKHIANEVAVLATALAAVETFSIRYSIVPIAQSTAAVFWYLGILSLILYFRRQQLRWFLVLVGCSIAILFTHSLPVILLGIALPSVALARLIYAHFTERPMQPNSGVNIALLGILLLGVQSVFLSNFAYNIAIKVSMLVTSAGGVGATSAPAPSSAVPAMAANLSRLGSFAPSAVFGGFAAIAGLYIALQTELRTRQGVPTLLTITAVVAILSGVSVVVPEIALPIRFIFLLGGLFAVLVSLAVTDVIDSPGLLGSKAVKATAAVLVCLLIVTQPLSFMAAIEYPGGPRMYLSDDEIETKEWVLENIDGPVYTDYYYALEVVPSQFDDRAATEARTKASAAAARQHQIKPLSSELTNATIQNESYEYIIYRDIDVYRVQGGVYRLSWDYHEWLREHYEPVYQNGDVTVFRRVNASEG